MEKKSVKTIDSIVVSVRTPRSSQINLDFRKFPIDKFKSIKSITTITYRDIETTIFPSELNENH